MYGERWGEELKRMKRSVYVTMVCGIIMIGFEVGIYVLIVLGKVGGELRLWLFALEIFSKSLAMLWLSYSKRKF